jgi:hypothetical protein
MESTHGQVVNPDYLRGITYQNAHGEFRYIYPDSPHWMAGFLLKRNWLDHWVTVKKISLDRFLDEVERQVYVGNHNR